MARSDAFNALNHFLEVSESQKDIVIVDELLGSIRECYMTIRGVMLLGPPTINMFCMINEAFAELHALISEIVEVTGDDEVTLESIIQDLEIQMDPEIRAIDNEHELQVLMWFKHTNRTALMPKEPGRDVQFSWSPIHGKPWKRVFRPIQYHRVTKTQYEGHVHGPKDEKGIEHCSRCGEEYKEQTTDKKVYCYTKAGTFIPNVRIQASYKKVEYKAHKEGNIPDKCARCGKELKLNEKCITKMPCPLPINPHYTPEEPGTKTVKVPKVIGYKYEEESKDVFKRRPLSRWNTKEGKLTSGHMVWVRPTERFIVLAQLRKSLKARGQKRCWPHLRKLSKNTKLMPIHKQLANRNMVTRKYITVYEKKTNRNRVPIVEFKKINNTVKATFVEAEVPFGGGLQFLGSIQLAPPAIRNEDGRVIEHYGYSNKPEFNMIGQAHGWAEIMRDKFLQDLHDGDVGLCRKVEWHKRFARKPSRPDDMKNITINQTPEGYEIESMREVFQAYKIYETTLPSVVNGKLALVKQRVIIFADIKYINEDRLTGIDTVLSKGFLPEIVFHEYENESKIDKREKKTIKSVLDSRRLTSPEA